jgi:hypothetical protein
LGRELFQKIRDYRRLHELCWEMPDELVRPHTEKEIDELKNKLYRRGGAKENNVYDVIKHKKKKIRARVIMDQKANSIADLAAGLLEFGDLSLAEAEDREREKKTAAEAHEKKVQRMVKLANDYEPDVQSLKHAIADQETAMKLEGDEQPDAMRNNRISDLRLRLEESENAVQTLMKAREPLGKKIRNLAEKIIEAERGLEFQEVFVITPEHLPHERKALEEDNIAIQERNAATMRALAPAVELRLELEKMQLLLESLPTQSNVGTSDPENMSAENPEDTSVEREEAPKQSASEKRALHLGMDPSHQLYPPSEDIFPAPSEEDLKKASSEILQKLVPRPPVPPTGPSHTTEGVTVQWADIYDAQFAQEWPDNVKHERMGIVRHKPPAPAGARPSPARTENGIGYAHGHPIADAPAFDVATFKASQWRRTRGVPTESTPVNFRHPKDATLTAPWLQSADPEQLEDLQARQRAWNSAHFPGADADGKPLAAYAPSAEKSPDAPTEISYETAVERKARVDALGAKILAATLPQALVPLTEKGVTKLVRNTPRVMDQNLFKTMPGTKVHDEPLRKVEDAQEQIRIEEERVRQIAAEEEKRLEEIAPKQAENAAQKQARLKIAAAKARNEQEKARKEQEKARRANLSDMERQAEDDKRTAEGRVRKREQLARNEQEKARKEQEKAEKEQEKAEKEQEKAKKEQEKARRANLSDMERQAENDKRIAEGRARKREELARKTDEELRTGRAEAKAKAEIKAKAAEERARQREEMARKTDEEDRRRAANREGGGVGREEGRER